MLKGAFKRIYKRTNKRGPGVSLQMMRCEQTQLKVLKEIVDTDDDQEAGSAGAVSTNATPTSTADLTMSRRSQRVAAGDLLMRPEIEKFAEQLIADGVRWVTVAKTSWVLARFEWGAVEHVQLVRATPAFIGTPPYSFIKYMSATGAVRWGRTKLVVRSLERQARSCVVVQRLHRADARSGCVLTAYGCLRLAWDFLSVGDCFLALDIVDRIHILRLEEVQVD
eukprot:TRINITY_DN15746_c0_g1_i1.p1 TRINITY_DN15746_c0_g1~~TRINITY_DN15746_c0_g1_i1.p1  ORF type:complete len:223 (-),score=31.61 TRINITY_DN15746_c0_g1_i1:282-950(-)